MPVLQVSVQRFSATGDKPFEEVLERLEAAIGRPDMAAFWREVMAAETREDVERAIERAVGVSGLMEFTRFDLGAMNRKHRGADAPRSLRLVVGNPLIMRQMVEPVPDAASYAPVTILIDERRDGVHVSYDRMASLLGPYQNAAALSVARDLDVQVESLLRAACL
ncbi:MAG TPA: DUF302 domain-containing protein [bacterium]|nr:DUF302 domain-containing protein [bacterium]